MMTCFLLLILALSYNFELLAKINQKHIQKMCLLLLCTQPGEASFCQKGQNRCILLYSMKDTMHWVALCSKFLKKLLLMGAPFHGVCSLEDWKFPRLVRTQIFAIVRDDGFIFKLDSPT
jgi:hypothetical protein